MNKSLLKKLYSKLDEGTPDKESRVLIVDFMNTFIRVWSAVPVLNEGGYHVGGITGFLYTLGSQIRNLSISKVYIVLDGKDGNSEKRKVYSEYKGNRNTKVSLNRSFGNNEEPDESFKRQLLRIVEYLDCLPVTIVQVDRREADDVISYLTHLYEDKDNNVIISSADRDFFQLINEKVSIWSPTKKKLYHEEQVKEEWGVTPQNLIYLRCVLGDSSDNIPGVKGIGQKTFIKLFEEILEEDNEYDDFIDYIAQSSNPKMKKLQENLDVIKRNYKLMKLDDEILNGREKSLVRKIMERYDNKDIHYTDFLKLCKADRIFEIMRDPQGWLHRNITRLV